MYLNMKSLQDFIKYLRTLGISNNVIEAFKVIKREWFVPEEYKNFAYNDEVIPIKEGVTISQPSVLATMIDALEIKPGLKILEIGTGSGFSTAILSYLLGPNGRVISVEMDEDAYSFAKERLNYLINKKIIPNNIKLILGDGSLGYSQEAPYDRVISHASCTRVPNPWIWQLKDNGVIVAPIGPVWDQKLAKIKKVSGKLEKEILMDVLFVPLRGKFGDIE